MSAIAKGIGFVFAVLVFAILVGVGVIALAVGLLIAIVAAPVLLVADYLSKRGGRW